MEPTSHDEAIERLQRIYQARGEMNEAAARLAESRRQLLAAQADYRKKRAAWELLAAPDPEMPILEGLDGERPEGERRGVSPPVKSPTDAQAETNGHHSATSLPIAHLVKRDAVYIDPSISVLNFSPETQRQLENGRIHTVGQLETIAALSAPERYETWRRMQIAAVQGRVILKMLAAWKSRQQRGQAK